MLPLLAGGGLAAAVAGVWAVATWNRLHRLANAADRAWGNVDLVLQQRAEEVPRLVAVVQAAARHERGLLERVAQARAVLAAPGPVPAKAAASQALDAAVPRLVALAEAAPRLGADAAFRALQARLAELDSLLADRRSYYNEAVKLHNTRIAEMPARLLARTMGARPRAYFQADAKPGQRAG